MRRLMTSLPISLAVFAACDADAAGPKPCEELRAEIAAKIDARGVSGYTLEIVAPEDAGERKIVGRCEGGTRRIVYLRAPVPAVPEPRALAARAQ
jgi:hypothetical protein